MVGDVRLAAAEEGGGDVQELPAVDGAAAQLVVDADVAEIDAEVAKVSIYPDGWERTGRPGTWTTRAAPAPGVPARPPPSLAARPPDQRSRRPSRGPRRLNGGRRAPYERAQQSPYERGHAIVKRRVDYPAGARRGAGRFVPSWRQLLGLAFLGLCALGGAVGWVYATTPLPDPNPDARAEATVYYWADGSQMVSVGAVNRQSVPLSQVPAALQNAAIAAENATFRSDPGFSVSGLARAVVGLARGGELQGGSTITQQYVKNTFLTQEQTVERKLRELCLAVKLSRTQSKDEILQGYLNTSWFGRDAYGVQAAAVAYYGTDVERLDPVPQRPARRAPEERGPVRPGARRGAPAQGGGAVAVRPGPAGGPRTDVA